jgi:uncharacterized protein YjbJ (UPF0337 family)
MKPNNDEIRGDLDKASGKVKEVAGRTTGNLDLENEGLNQQDTGDIERGFGKARRKVGEALKDTGKKLNE